MGRCATRDLDRQLGRGGAGAVVVCGLDNMYEFNRANGHDLGDERIRRAAGVLRSQTPITGRSVGVYRVAGDMFMVRLHDTDLDAAKQFAEAARERINRLGGELGATRPEDRPPTSNFGVAAWPKGHQPLSTRAVLGRIDDAMHNVENTVVVAQLDGD
jgi:diguanylate cyclase (GGDEF)-like protein